MSETHPDRSRSPTPSGEFDMLTVHEVAAMLRVSRMTVYRLAESGAITSGRIGRSIDCPARRSSRSYAMPNKPSHRLSLA
jgi:excisionase family DNA binding protein